MSGEAVFPMPRGCPYQPPEGYAALRGPVSRVRLTSGGPAWVVTGYEQARTLFRDPRLSSDSANPGHPEVALPEGAARPSPERKRAVQTFVEMDDPEHAAHRRMVAGRFTVRRAREMRPLIQRDTDTLIDAMLAKGPPADLVTALAVPLPAATLGRVFGVPEAERQFFQEQAARPVLSKSESGAAFGALYGCFERLIEAKRARPGDDLLSDVAARVGAGDLALHRAVDMCMMILVAGHETTANTIALGALTLLAHPGQLALLREDPSAMPDAVEELLRYLAVADTIPRVATADIEIGGQVIRPGAGVYVSLAAANRDPAAFPHADRFDVRRSRAGHLTFSFGVHQCLGQNLARTELDVVFSTLFRRVPGLRPAVPEDRIPVKEAVGLQGVTELPVTW